MIRDMKQETGENSNAYQAKRDITIVQQGMDYQNVKQLCLDLIHENFPKLKEEAMRQVNENVMTLANEIKIEIDRRKEASDPNKFAHPDVQAALNEAVQGAAKKGKKADLKILASLVASRIDKENSDLLDITIEEAIRITPKLTKAQLSFLSIKHFVSSIRLTSPSIQLQHLDALSTVILSNFSEDCVISNPNILYLSGIGVLDFNPTIGHDAYEIQYNDYKGLAESAPKFKELVKSEAPNLSKILDIYNQDNFGNCTLNSFGQVIALTNIGRVIGKMDLKLWIN